MLGGYCNRILRVNLSTGKCTVTPLPDVATLRMYIGGTGLGMKLLVDEMRPDQQATDPDAPFIMAAGPLAGTSAPSSGHLAVVSLNFNTPYAVATGHSSGYWGAYLKHAGYDAIVFTGRADKPVFLWIDDDKVEIRDAAAYWGKDTRETERLIKRELGDEEKISVACIGPAGEVMLPGASIKNDRNHGSHKGSVGAVMGSKRLKAVAVRGTKQVPLSNPQAFGEVTQKWADAIHVIPPEGEGAAPIGALMAKAGVTKIYSFLGEHHMLACKNYSDPVWAEAYTKRFVDDAANKFTVVPKAAYNCNIECAYDCTINDGPYQGFTASMCGGGENMEGAASMIGIEDPASALVMTDYYDAMGIDSSVGGALLGMAFELYERGILTKEATGGLELKWGNMEAGMELLNQMIEGRGFGGRVLAKGLKEAAHILGPAAEACVIHIRGGGINMHDWRAAWSVLLGQIVSGAGVCWQGYGVDSWTTEPDLGYKEFATGFIAEGKAEAVAKTQKKKLWEDTLGVCWFAAWGVPGILTYTADAIKYATGWNDFSADEALLVGERMVALQRIIAIKRGFTSKDEFDISDRLLEAPKAGTAAGKSIKPHLERMVREYYELVGWDLNGTPTPAALERVGLSGLLT